MLSNTFQGLIWSKIWSFGEAAGVIVIWHFPENHVICLTLSFLSNLLLISKHRKLITSAFIRVAELLHIKAGERRILHLKNEQLRVNVPSIWPLCKINLLRKFPQTLPTFFLLHKRQPQLLKCKCGKLWPTWNHPLQSISPALYEERTRGPLAV